MDNKQTVPYTLPNGQNVVLHQLTAEDHDCINRWVQKEYLKNLDVVMEHVPEQERHQFLLAALAHAKTLLFQYGEGREILYGSVFGVARLVYQLISNPPIDFMSFHRLFFPNGWGNIDGIEELDKVINAIYAGESSIFDDVELKAPLSTVMSDVAKEYNNVEELLKETQNE